MSQQVAERPIIDQRTRVDGQVPEVDATRFLDDELAALFEKRAATLTSAAHLDLRPMEVRVGDGRWLLAREDRRYTVRRQDAGATAPKLVLTLTEQQLADLVNDQVTPVGLMTAGSLELAGGGIGRFLDWWLVLRSAIDDVAVYTAGSVDLPSDLRRSFTLDDDPDEIVAFLEAAGFLHLRGVFTEDEM